MASPALAVTPTVLLQTGDPYLSGTSIERISTLVGTPDGGYLTRIKADIFSFTFFSNVEVESYYGSFGGAPAGILRTEDNVIATVDNGGRGSFVHLDIGSAAINELGQIAYTTRVAGAPQASSLFTDTSMWLDDRLLILEGDALDSSLGLPGYVWEGAAPAGVAPDGTVIFSGSYTNDGGTTIGQGIFSVGPDGTGWQTFFKTGDTLGVSGSVVPLAEDNDRFVSDLSNRTASPDGSLVLSMVDVEEGTTSPIFVDELTINGVAQTWAGSSSVIRGFDPIPASAGGLPGEFIGTASLFVGGFDQVDINDQGSYIFGGFSNLDSDFIVLDGEIIHREGDVLPRFGDGASSVTLGSDAKSVMLNSDGDYVFTMGTNLDVLVVNGEVVFATGDELASEGSIDAINNAIISDRNQNNEVIVRFSGREFGQSNQTSQIYELVLQLDPLGLLGDFDESGILDIADVDLLAAAILAGSSDSQFDLDGSSSLSNADLAFWIVDLFGSALGDSNLDGAVDLIDLSALASNFGGPGTYGQGDFNADGTVDLIDLSTLASNFGFSNSIPEPASLILLGLGGVLLSRRQQA
ncbi:PEP-CTERM sorting domain-containing protein [Mucisphaera sp.]|uniref:PEP-CTERM sorting domain-containing protein n=1 Tax=Mucisphaera sp. TaxID=2913024 RepID=UPI003D09BDF1